MPDFGFIVSDVQLALDTAQIPYDLQGTRAHALALHAAGILDGRQLAAIGEACDRIGREAAAGDYRIDPARGAHLSLERRITEIAGEETGGKVPTARSRNDQVLVTGRLWLRDRVQGMHALLADAVAALLDLASRHSRTVMPGYTHGQPAKPTTLGHVLMAYAEMFTRDLGRLEQAWERFDACPLGAAESFGSAWSLDRELTARLLGFSRVEVNTAAAVGSRGECEAEVLGVLAFVGLHLSKIAQDLLLWTTWEFGYLRLDETLAPRKGAVTGSSIMPQKKNPDVLELLRARASKLYALHFEAMEVLKGLPLGYNRDSRETKEAAARGFDLAGEALVQLSGLLPRLAVDADRMERAARESFCLATDLADALARGAGLPYRQVYHLVGDWVKEAIDAGRTFGELSCADLVGFASARGIGLTLDEAAYAAMVDPLGAVKLRDHIGSPAPLRVEEAIVALCGDLERHALWRLDLAERFARAESLVAERFAALTTCARAPH